MNKQEKLEKIEEMEEALEELKQAIEDEGALDIIDEIMEYPERFVRLAEGEWVDFSQIYSGEAIELIHNNWNRREDDGEQWVIKYRGEPFGDVIRRKEC